MSNKIDSAVDNLATALAALKTAGTIRKIGRGVILPTGHEIVPVVSLAVVRFARQDDIWTADVLVMLVANRGGLSVDERVTELVAQIEAAWTVARNAGAIGAVLDQPVWEPWYPPSDRSPLDHVGARGSTRIRVEEPLIIPT